MSHCQACETREAVVHITRIVGGTAETTHLCEACAADRGITSHAVVAGLPADTLFPASETAPPVTGREVVCCPGCGTTLADIESSKRIGCTVCWSIFAGPLRELLRRIQGSALHTGKKYSGVLASFDDEAELALHQLERLRQALASAVAAERFEDAAVLRDQLRALEG